MNADAIGVGAVLGAGTMGHGIAQSLAMCGIETRLFDLDAGALEKGLASVKVNLEKGVARGKVSEEARGRDLPERRGGGAFPRGAESGRDGRGGDDQPGRRGDGERSGGDRAPHAVGVEASTASMQRDLWTSVPDAEDPRLTAGRFLSDVAGRFADRSAIVFEGRALTYSEVESGARTLARALAGAGVVKGARVALLMANRPEWIDLCIRHRHAWRGARAREHLRKRAAELDYILRHSDASLLLMQPSLLKHRFLDDLLGAHPESRRRKRCRGDCVCRRCPSYAGSSVSEIDDSPRRRRDRGRQLLARGARRGRLAARRRHRTRWSPRTTR